MAKAQLCPVCNGSGRYNEKPCHGCGGKGWVEVQDDNNWYPYYPYTPYYLDYPSTSVPWCPNTIIYWD